MQLEISEHILPPEFEFTGEYRNPKSGEPYLYSDSTVSWAPRDFTNASYPILRKKRVVRAYLFEKNGPKRTLRDGDYCLGLQNQNFYLHNARASNPIFDQPWKRTEIYEV